MTKQQIQQSMDYKWYQRQCKSVAAFWGVMAVISIFVSMFVAFTRTEVIVSFGVGAAIGAVLGVCFLPIWIYLWVKMSHLSKSADGFVVAQTILDKPHLTGGKNRHVYFTVTFDDGNGNKVTADTTPLFGGGWFDLYLLEDYNNKTVDIAYNSETGKVVVLGKRD